MDQVGRRGFHHALYSYHPHRPQLDSPPSGDSVARFLQHQSTTDGDFSLSLVTHNLEGAVETALRDFVARRLSRGTVYSGAGNVVAFEAEGYEPFCCYFSLLRARAAAPAAHTEVSELDSLARALGGVSFIEEQGPDSLQTPCEYVVCFLTDEDGLELYPFRLELDVYSHALLAMLEKLQPSDQFLEDSEISGHLHGWADTALFYVKRCVQTLGRKISPVLYAALCCIPVVVESSDPSCTMDDVDSFVKACSLEALMKAQQQAVSSSLIDLADGEGAKQPSQPSSLMVRLSPGSCEVSNGATNMFCQSWADALMNVGESHNPFVIRQVVDNYKLKAIQHMNTLRRLLRHSETDHYALYRCYVFLDTCGMGDILLSNAMQEAHDTGSADNEAVCRVLNKFIDSVR